MHNYKGFLLLFLFILQFANAQTDSIRTYIEKCRQHSQNTDSLFYYSNLLINIDDKSAKAEGYFAKGYAYRNKMQLDSALLFFDESLKYIDQNNYADASRSVRLASIAASQIGKNTLALDYISQLKQLAIDAEDSLGFATALNHEGIIYKNKGDLNKAIQKYTAAGEIQNNKNYRQTHYTYTNIAIAYTESERDSMALVWFHKAYEAAHRFKDSVGIIKSINNLGSYFKKHQPDSSLIYFEKLLNIEQRLPINQKSLLFQNLAELNSNLGNIDKSLLYYHKAEPLVRKGQDLKRKIELLTVLLGIEKKQQNYTAALQVSDSLIGLIKTSNIPNKLLPVYLEKVALLKKEKDFEEAVLTLDIYNRVKDSLSTMQDAIAIQKIISDYELAEKELELNALLNKGFFSKNKILIYVLSLLLIIVVIYFFYFKKRTKIHNENTQKNKQITLKSKHVLNTKDIIYIKSDGHYLEYHTTTSKLPIIERNRLKNVLESLSDYGFIQVHRSHLVNTSMVRVVNTYSLQLDNNLEVPLSRSFKQKLKEEKHPLFI